MVGKYKVITLCGSTRFKDVFMETQKRLTLEGNIVISDIDNAWMYNCRISKVYGSKNSIAKVIAAKQRGEYIEI